MARYQSHWGVKVRFVASSVRSHHLNQSQLLFLYRLEQTSMKSKWKWVSSRNRDCLVTWFCYKLTAKPGNKTATVLWPDQNTIIFNIHYSGVTWASWRLREGHPVVIGGFPSQRARNAEKNSLSWRGHAHRVRHLRTRAVKHVPFGDNTSNGYREKNWLSKGTHRVEQLFPDYP